MSEVHGKTYQYTPLSPGEIRLLVAVSSPVGGAAWSLKTVRLCDGNESTEDNQFDALSYTWGDQSFTFPLMLSNDRAPRPLRIHHNLHEALPYLARRRSAKPLWIDAVCINQADDIEKADQIRLMNKIYRSASRVWIWFGPGNNHTKKAVALLPLIATVGAQSSELDPGLLNETPESQGLPEVASPVWTGVYDILDNQWFSRLWTVQEAVLARNITCLCGDCEIEWSLLERVMDTGPYIDYLHDATGITTNIPRHDEVFLIRQASQRRECAVSESKPFSSAASHLLMTSLLISSSHRCFDPRDSVLGILGLVDELEIGTADVHEEGVSLTELYARFCWFLLQNVRIELRQFWALLNMASAPKKAPALPSWCPDFYGQSSDDADFRVPQRTKSAIYSSSSNAGKPGRDWADQGTNPRDLVLQGTLFDTVSKLYAAFPKIVGQIQLRPRTVDGFSKSLAAAQAWERTIALELLGTASLTEAIDAAFLSAQGEQKAQLSLEGYVRALWGYESKDGKPNLTTSDLYEFRVACHKFHTFMKRVKELHNKYDEEAMKHAEEAQLTEADREALAYFEGGSPTLRVLTGLLEQQLHGRLFKTVMGRVGLGGPSLQDGDDLVVFDWAPTPHALRPAVGRYDQAYTLVGQIHMDGLMNGEVYDLGFQKQDVTLV